MFGLSLSKLIFTVVSVVVVWMVYRKVQTLTSGETPKQTRSQKAAEAAARMTKTRAGTTEDLTACPACGAYVVAGTVTDCAKGAACPMKP